MRDVWPLLGLRTYFYEPQPDRPTPQHKTADHHYGLQVSVIQRNASVSVYYLIAMLQNVEDAEVLEGLLCAGQ